MENKLKDVDGIRYINIPLYSSTGESINIRLFETLSPSRLDFETHNEFKIRRKFNNNQIKKHMNGYSFWNSKNLGTLTKEKALSVLQQVIKEKNEKTKEI